VKKRLVLLSTLLLCVTAASNVSAALWTIEATSVDTDWSDFTLVVDDQNGDSIFQCCTSGGYPSTPDSVVSFSGVEKFAAGGTGFYDVLDYTPDLIIGGLTLVGDTNPKWGFIKSVGSAGKGVSQWTYTAAVPIPAAVWLFGSALAGLGWLRRRQTA
jgi:hypothetical protein